MDEYHISNARNLGIDGRIGPLQKRVITSFWNDSAPFMFQGMSSIWLVLLLTRNVVKIPKNIYYRGENIAIDFVLDNKGSIEVDAIRVSLDQMETTVEANVGSNKKVVKTRVTKVNCEWYKEVCCNTTPRAHSIQGNKFPCRRGNFKGTLNYKVSTHIDVTECDNSACWAREFRLKVMCEIPNHQNVWLLFPIRIVM